MGRMFSDYDLRLTVRGETVQSSGRKYKVLIIEKEKEGVFPGMVRDVETNEQRKVKFSRDDLNKIVEQLTQ